MSDLLIISTCNYARFVLGSLVYQSIIDCSGVISSSHKHHHTKL
ncbi:hypothetical protein THOB06_210040 [Vibrio rotiferianus]|nr:hypothetical protein THOB06_210040 [Vibrio rotiferianus]